MPRTTKSSCRTPRCSVDLGKYARAYFLAFTALEERFATSALSAGRRQLGPQAVSERTIALARNRRKALVGRWYEDLIEADHVRRVRRHEFLGTLKELPTKRLAQRELENRLDVLNSPTYRARPTATFSEFADRWEAAIVPQLKPSTAINYRSHLRRHLKPFFGAYSLREISPEMVQAFVSKLKAIPLTVRHVFNTLQSLWRSARTWGYVLTDVTEDIRLPDRLLSERRHFSTEEMRRAIAAAPEPYKTCFWLAAETGTRGRALRTTRAGCGLRPVDCQRCSDDLVGKASDANNERLQPALFDFGRFSRTHLGPSWLVAPESIRAYFRHAKRNALAVPQAAPQTPSSSERARIAEPLRHSQMTVAERVGVPLKTIQGRVGPAARRLRCFTHTRSGKMTGNSQVG